MGKVKITEKPGVWPYVLVNDFKSSPYFAYEEVDSAGNRKFVKVLKGAPEELSHDEPVSLVLTKKRKTKISQFLRETLKNPLKYAEFMSAEWIEQLVRFLDLFKENHSNEATLKLVAEVWLKDSFFQKLTREIRRNLKDSGESFAAKATEEASEEQPCGSQACRQKRPTPEKDESSDGSKVKEVERKKKRNQSEIEVITL